MGAVTQFKSRYKAETAELALVGWDAFMQEGAVPDWVNALRQRGAEQLQQNGLPTLNLERWKYTNLLPQLKKASFDFAPSDVSVAGQTEYVRKLMDHALDAPDWLKNMAQARPVGAEQYGDMMLWDAVNAFFRDGLTLDVPANTQWEEPLEVGITGHDGTYFVPRTFFCIGKNSDFTLIETHTGEGSYWNNRVTQIKVAKGARFRHYRIQENSAQALYTQNTHVEVEAGGQYEAFVLTDGAALSRNQIHVDLLGEGAACYLNGINMLSGSQHADTTITVDHHAENCISKQSYRSVVDGKAQGVFQGKIYVHSTAQKTDAYQLSNALLLSPQATMNTKPELEIYADDVKCSHGASAGKLDEEALFYLCSRGIPEDQARALLLEAFLAQAVDRVTHKEMRERTIPIISKWLGEL